MAAQEKLKVIPVENFVRDEQYPGCPQAFGTKPPFDPVRYALRNGFKVAGT